MITVSFENNIKEILRRKGWSIRKLSKVINKDYGYVHRLVSTDPLPEGTTIGTLKPVANALDVSVDSLFGKNTDNVV